MRERLIDQYHKTLALDESLTPEFCAHLKNMMHTDRLLYGEREIGVALRPHLLTRTQYDVLVQASEILAGAFEKVASALLSEPARLQTLRLTDREIKLALAEPGYSTLAVTTRLDAFVQDREVKFVEYNAENPSSLTDQAGLNKILMEVGAMRDIAAQGTDVLTIGQYLRPSPLHLPIERYWTPDEFRALRDEGMTMGYRHVESGPLVRSSYHAERHVGV